MDELVCLCRCADLVRAQAIRASIEARGIHCLIDGEHQRQIMGMFGTVVELRIMVPRSQLRVAHALASDIIEDLPLLELDDDDELGWGEREDSPLRRPMPGDLEPPEDESEDEDGDSEYEHEDEYEDEYEDEGEYDDEDDDAQLAEMRERKTLGWRRLLVGGWVVGTVVVFIVTGSIRALLTLGVVVALVYLRVLPVTPEPKPKPGRLP